MPNAGSLDLALALKYAVILPAQVLLPSFVGVPASWSLHALPGWFNWALGSLFLGGVACGCLWPGQRRNRPLLLVAAGMVYMGYVLAIAPRIGYIKEGFTTSANLVYFHGSRYQVLPLLGLAALFAVWLACFEAARRWDARPGRSAMMASLLGLVLLGVQFPEVSRHWVPFFLDHPDQKRTLSVLHRVEVVVRDEGLTRTQLLRINAPVLRAWCGGLVANQPLGFPLMMMIAAPQQTTEVKSDDEARALLRQRLTRVEKAAIGMGSCAPFGPAEPIPAARTIAVARLAETIDMEECGPGKYRAPAGQGVLCYEFSPAARARYLVFPGLRANQDFAIQWSEAPGRWHPAQTLYWLIPPTPTEMAVIDLGSIMHMADAPITQVSLRLAKPGELSLQAPPRLLR